MERIENAIVCPQCGFKINVNQVLYQQIQAKLAKDYEEKFQQKESEYKKQLNQLLKEKTKLEEEKVKIKLDLEKEYNLRLTEETQKLIQKKENEFEKRLNEEKRIIRENFENEYKSQLTSLQEKLRQQMDELSKSRQQILEMEKMKGEYELRLKNLTNQHELEKERLKLELNLEKEKIINERIKELNQKFEEQLKQKELQIKEQIYTSFDLQLKEKEKIINDLRTQLHEAQRRAEQGSVQLQGEIQELELEQLLRDTFKYDDIKEVGKGQRGADVIQIVRNEHGAMCGKIYYESKRTKNFDQGWIKKLRDDGLREKADILVLVTDAMPQGRNSFYYDDGVWVCKLHEVKGLATVLRHSIIQLHGLKVVQENKGTKMEQLYNYLTGSEFAETFKAIIDGFIELNKSYQDEKMRMTKIWKEREKQLERILTNTIEIYGSLKGIAGSSIPSIDALEDHSKLRLQSPSND